MKKALQVLHLLSFLLIPIVNMARKKLKGLLPTGKDPVLKKSHMKADKNILFLHHSTGRIIFNGGVERWFEDYNIKNKVTYKITQQDFPKRSPYGWNNYPFDYWNIWVKNSGDTPFMREPTLEMITRSYDVVVLKHCFPVSNIKDGNREPDIGSHEKTIGNYKLQYNALKEKMKEFPQTRFLIWTGAAQVKRKTDEKSASRAREFFDWVREEWDEKGDNIFLWDFHWLETEGGLYLKDAFSREPNNSHPNMEFSRRVAPLLCRRIVDVIEDRGDDGRIDGSVF
jgi:hypothetical protein